MVLLSKNELTRMFLKVLWEIQYGNMKGHSHGVDSIVPKWINDYYQIELESTEIQLVCDAVQELKASNLITRDSRQYSDNFVVLTESGKEVVEKQKDPDIFGLRLEQVVKNGELLSRCLGHFTSEEYEDSVFNAFKLVEEKVRNKAGLGAGDLGVDLMTKALHPRTGKLVIPTCKLPPEQEGVYNLFKGAIAFYKNPSSHRSVVYDNRLSVIRVIALAELLLGILEKAELRT